MDSKITLLRFRDSKNRNDSGCDEGSAHRNMYGHTCEKARGGDNADSWIVLASVADGPVGRTLIAPFQEVVPPH